MALKRGRKKTPKTLKDQPSVDTEIVDMDKQLEAIPATSGSTPFQMYMREKILNATKD